MAHPSASCQDRDLDITARDTSRPPYQSRNGSRAILAPDADAVQPAGSRRQVTTPTTSAASIIKSSTTEVDSLSGAGAAIEATSAQHRPSRESEQSDQLYKDDPDMYDNSQYAGNYQDEDDNLLDSSASDSQSGYEEVSKRRTRRYPVKEHMWEVNNMKSRLDRLDIRVRHIILAPDSQQARYPGAAKGVPTHNGLLSNERQPMAIMKLHMDGDNVPEYATCLRHYTYKKRGPFKKPLSERNKLFRLLDNEYSRDGRGPTVNEPVYGVFYDRPIDRQAYINGAEVVQIRLTVAVKIIGEIQPVSWARLDTFPKEQGEESVQEVYRQFPEIRQQATQQASLNGSTNVEKPQQDQQRLDNVAGPVQGIQGTRPFILTELLCL